MDAIAIDVSSFDDFEATTTIVPHVPLPKNWGSDADMKRRIADQALLVCNVEECAVIDAANQGQMVVCYASWG